MWGTFSEFQFLRYKVTGGVTLVSAADLANPSGFSCAVAHYNIIVIFTYFAPIICTDNAHVTMGFELDLKIDTFVMRNPCTKYEVL